MVGRKKLAWTVWLDCLHPEASRRSCGECERYSFHDMKEGLGRPMKLADGSRMPRPKGVPTPCHLCPKVPSEFEGRERVRANAIEPTERSRRVIAHYRTCRAVNRYPLDPLFEFNAEIVCEAERRTADDREARRQGDMLVTILGVLGRRG